MKKTPVLIDIDGVILDLRGQFAKFLRDKKISI